VIERIRWTPELVEKFWNGVANTRLDDLSFGKVAGPEFLRLIDRFLDRDGRHLDFGAGSGDVVKLLLERGYRTAGFDPSPERQAKLAEKIGSHEHFLGIQGNESRSQYDVVLLMEVIEHILEEDFDSTMQRISSFVRPDGLLIVSTPNNEDIEQASVFCPLSQILFHPWQHVRSFTPASLCETLEKFGFRKEQLILADFSNDAKLIENCKRYQVAETRRAVLTQELGRYIEDFRREIDQEVESVGRLSQNASGSSSGNVLRRLLHSVISWKERIIAAVALQRLVHGMQSKLQARSDTMTKLKRAFLAVDRHGGTIDAGPDHEGINLRLGHETTIIYVGRRV